MGSVGVFSLWCPNFESQREMDAFPQSTETHTRSQMTHIGSKQNKNGELNSNIGANRTRARNRYHSARNKFDRFRWFLELIGRFQFEFCRCQNYIFEQFEFWVCSKFNHTHHVAVNVPLLWPVCTHTISIRMLLRP